ncbi:MAG TPA: class I SAM-dependent methyltransferase [Elusimicrobiota bacterium]|nr:class I SAM-dependent methyltransferase [Elusimicrobiota bacterium]
MASSSHETEQYWSNLDRAENLQLLAKLQTQGPRDVIHRHYPQLEDIIYSPKRGAGLELLELTGQESCIDYGCMWGALTIPLAKRAGFVLGVDKTLESLRFLQARVREEGFTNIGLLRHDITAMPVLAKPADVAVVNGVLEWVPEHGAVELKRFFGQSQSRRYSGSPMARQLLFLRRVRENLTPAGKLYLAIENRFDLRMFLGYPDPHTNLRGTTIAPRWLANIISQRSVQRPYVNWIYSFHGLRKVLIKAGFSRIDCFACFPDYRYPQRIVPYDRSLRQLNSILFPLDGPDGKRTLKRYIAHALERLAFRYGNLKCLAPSIIAIGRP